MKKILLSLVMLIPVLAGCSVLQVAPYDPFLHTSMLEIKGDVLALYQTFTTDVVDVRQTETIRYKMNVLKEYAQNHEKGNAETIRQLEIVASAFNRHVNNRREHGPWSRIHHCNVKALMSDMLDHVIKLEKTKIRESR